MNELTFEERLKQLRKTYLEGGNEDKESQEINAFMSLSKEDKIKKIEEHLSEINRKKEILESTLQDKTSDISREDLEHNLEALGAKKQLMLQKLEYVKKDEFNGAKREKIKRQLAELEFKRCRLRMNNKDCSKLDKKIQEKQRRFRNDI
jgi:predicted GNAT family acetyltransferase